VIAILLAVAAVVIFGSGKFFRETERFVLYFSGSVKGLNIGAPVVFRGVQIGQVTDIKVRFDSAELSFDIPVIIDLTEGAIQNIGPSIEEGHEGEFMNILINRGLRAQLQLQSLVTGQLMVDLDLYPDKPAKFVSKGVYDIPGVSMEIPTIRTMQQKLTETLEEVPLSEIAQNISKAMAAITKMVTSPEFGDNIKEIHATLEAIKRLVNNVDNQVLPLSNALQETIRDAQKLVNDVDSQVAPLSDSVKQTAATTQATLNDARKLLSGIDQGTSPLGSRVAKNLDMLHKSLDQSRKTLKTYQNLVAEDSQLRYLLFNSLDEFAASARSLRALTDYLEQNPDALLRGKSR
jgi:paraquat-inducible protein B